MRSGISRILVSLSVGATVTAAAVLVPQAASADIVETTAVISATVPIPAYGAPNDYRTILRITPTLTAGGRYYFRGRWTAASNTTSSTMQGVFVRCTPPDGDPATAERSVYTTRNNVPSVASNSTVEVRWAFLPTVTGVHTCELVGYGVRLDTQTGARHFTTVSGTANTYLFTNDSGFDDLQEWRNDSEVVLDSSNTAVYVMRKTYTPREGTNMLRAHSDLEATAIRVAPLQATSWRVTMYVTQLNSAGTGCSAPVQTATHTVSNLDPAIVHLKTSLQADVPIRSGGGYADCVRSFAIKTQVTYLEGMDVRLEADMYSNSLAWSYVA